MPERTHICLLEEDPYVAGLYARKFEEKGWRVSVAETLEEAEAILAGHVDLFMLDIAGDTYDAMPLIRSLRNSGVWNALPIVVLTSAADRQKIDEGMRLSIDAYLLKGHFVPREVVEKVQHLLDR